MSQRRLYLDRAPGEDRGVVTLDGRPERLLLQRLDDPPEAPAGARYVARLARIDRTLAGAFVELGDGVQALLALAGPAKGLAEGAVVEVEVVAEARNGKLALVRLIASPAQGPARRLDAALSLTQRLQACAPDETLILGSAARDAADEAEAAVLARRHSLEGGLALTIEPTRALVAVDVDLEEGGAALSVGQANQRALWQAARLLRLKGLAGLVVIDLIGFPKDRRRLLEIAATAFAPDGPETVIGALGRFGSLDLAKPHLEQPLAERLLAADGRLSARSLAQDLVRRLDRQGRFEPGRRLEAVCAPEVAQILRPLVAQLGPRFAVREAPGTARDVTDIVWL